MTKTDGLMDDNQKFSINMQIGGFPIRLNIARKDEQLYRAAQSIITALYSQLHSAYENKSVEELWMLTAYQAAIQALRKQQNEDVQPLLDQIQQLEQQMDELLNDQ